MERCIHGDALTDCDKCLVTDSATFAALVEVARAASDLDNWDGWFKTELTQSVGDDEEAYENELVRRQDELSKRLHVLYALNPKLLEDGR